MSLPVPGGAGEVFLAFLKLGLTAFGGPAAHIGYFRETFVVRRRWLDDAAFADLVALAQFLPGPASSQTGLAIGLLRAGPLGALAAWAGFTLPSAVLMVLFAYGVAHFGGGLGQGWLHGLKAVAVAVVAQAVIGMARTLSPDLPRAGIALVAAALVLALPAMPGQLCALVFGAAAGLAALARPPLSGEAPMPAVGRGAGAAMVMLAVALLAGLPLAASLSGSPALALADAFYRAGALVFGGGHVVLPLLQSALVGPGRLAQDVFLAGYGAAQALPGPLFTLAAYLGAAMPQAPNGLAGAALGLVFIFLPGALLMMGVLPFWHSLRASARARAALTGINAAVVGLLAAALYDPVWRSGIRGPADLALAAAAFLALSYGRAPPWLVVILGALAGGLLG